MKIPGFRTRNSLGAGCKPVSEAMLVRLGGQVYLTRYISEQAFL